MMKLFRLVISILAGALPALWWASEYISSDQRGDLALIDYTIGESVVSVSPLAIEKDSLFRHRFEVVVENKGEENVRNYDLIARYIYKKKNGSEVISFDYTRTRYRNQGSNFIPPQSTKKIAGFAMLPAQGSPFEGDYGIHICLIFEGAREFDWYTVEMADFSLANRRNAVELRKGQGSVNWSSNRSIGFLPARC